MFQPGHVYLVNADRADRLLRLNLKRDISVGSLRRGAEEYVTVLARAAKAIDVTVLLDIDHDVALAAVKTAPDFKRFGDFIKLVDGDDLPTVFPPHGGPDIPLPPPVRPPELNPPKMEDIRAQIIAKKQADAGVTPGIGDPSISWRIEQLRDHATALGIKVLPTWGKALILRKIREAST